MTRHDEYLAAIREALNRHDPIGLIDMGCPETEYDLERNDVADALQNCLSERAVQVVVHSIFRRWFDNRLAGPLSAYAPLAAELFRIRRQFFPIGPEAGKAQPS